MSVDVEIIDERRITIKSGTYDVPQTQRIADFILRAADDGYVLSVITPFNESDMRGESWFAGVALTFRRSS